MPDPALDQQPEMRPIHWWAIAIMLSDTIEHHRSNTRTDVETLHHASSCYRRARQYTRTSRQLDDFDLENAS